MEAWLIFTLISFFLMALFNVVLKLSAGKVDSFLMIFLTGLFATIFVLPIIAYRKTLHFSSYGLIGGLLWGFSVASLLIALSKADVSRVIPIASLSGSFAAVIGILILGESITLSKVLGIILSTLAIILLSI
ncbi:MAG: EamA family transporter [Candidatus Aenigmarchaeota archaeon]|nr:EamA family transporter [Candidatus Aenigmarchaeota archaeon]